MHLATRFKYLLAEGFTLAETVDIVNAELGTEALRIAIPPYDQDDE
jgi:hypothetical protein